MISQNQSDFKLSYSSINQFSAITHGIYRYFNSCDDARAVFRDISKVFDKVWHRGLICQLKQNGIFGNLLETLSKFSKDKKKRAVLHSQISFWENVEVGIP